jgi:hypothetical protein
LAESDHPYENDFEKTWNVSEPGAAEIRLHFKDLQLAKSIDYDDSDKLFILDRYGNIVETYGGHSGIDSQDFWTDWYKGDKLSVKLVTDKTRPCYGFIVDKMDFKMDESIASDPYTAGPTETQSSSTSDTEADNEDSSNVLTITVLSSSANPSTFGQSITLIAEVGTSSQENEEPSGEVTFMDGTMPIGTVDLNSGKAALKTSSLSADSHSITAEYSGDNYFEPSKSPTLTLTVLEKTDPEEPSDPKITRSFPEGQSSTESSQTNNESIWKNPIFIGIITTVLGGIIVDNCPPLKNIVRSLVSKFWK